MKLNDQIMFSTDRKRFKPGVFICHYPEAGAVKIKLLDGEMTARLTEVFTLDEYKAARIAAFLEENRVVIDLWNQYKKGKPRIAREANSTVSAVYTVLRQEEKYLLVKDAIKERVAA